jgi:maltose alpha-D-glucosyltransferase/alpha-amylase
MTKTIELAGRPVGELLDAARTGIDDRLPEFLNEQRWFSGKGAAFEAHLGDVVPIPSPHDPATSVGHLAMIDVAYADGRAPERYATALKSYPATTSDPFLPNAELARVHAADGDFVLGDAIADDQLVDGLVHAMRGGRLLAGDGATLAGQGATALDEAVRGLGAITAEPLSLHTSNTSIRVGGRDGRQYALKLVRRHDAAVEPGTPTRALDVWKGAYLTNEAGYTHTPGVLGSLEHNGGVDGLPRTVSVLTEFVPNDGDGWADALVRARGTLDLVRDGADPAAIRASVDDYARAANNHGRRLGELHVALSSGPEGSEFRGVLQDAGSVQRRTTKLMDDAERAAEQLRVAGYADDAEALTRLVPKRIAEVERATDELVPIEEIHVHGDFHLGQMLRTKGADDIHIIDLEGSPVLPLAERWQRTMALGDVARQRSSYEYAATTAAREAAEASPDTTQALREVADAWATRSKDEFLRGWLDATADQRFRHARSEFVPELREAEIANAVYETSYELGSRPDWVGIPLERLRTLLAGS